MIVAWKFLRRQLGAGPIKSSINGNAKRKQEQENQHQFVTSTKLKPATLPSVFLKRFRLAGKFSEDKKREKNSGF